MDNNFNQQPQQYGQPVQPQQYGQPVQPQYAQPAQPKQPLNLEANPVTNIVAKFSSLVIAVLAVLTFIFSFFPQFKVSANILGMSTSESAGFFKAEHAFAGIVVILFSLVAAAAAVVTVMMYDNFTDKIMRIVLKAAPAVACFFTFLASVISMAGFKGDADSELGAYGAYITAGGTFAHFVVWFFSLLVVIIAVADVVLYILSDGKVKPFNPIAGKTAKAPAYQQQAYTQAPQQFGQPVQPQQYTQAPQQPVQPQNPNQQ